MTSYQQHVARWWSCTRCPLHEGRTQVVLARGRIPCDVLFIGEAPGVSEDALGSPFVGPAGKLLDDIVERAVAPPEDCDMRNPWNDGLCVAFTNLVACFPLEEKRAGVNEPPREAIEACAPRLREFVSLARPRLIVCVGALAERWVPKIEAGMAEKDRRGRTMVSIVHPAFILSRLHPTAQPLAVQKAVVTIADALEELRV